MRQKISFNTLKAFKKISLLFLLIMVVIGETKGFADEKWQEYKTLHFIIYYRDVPEDFVKSIEETAEYYYYEIAKNLGFYRDKNWSFDERAAVYIYSDAQDYLASMKELPKWSAGAAFLGEKTIRTFPSQAGFFDSLLPHELGHIILREFIGSGVQVPSWFDEGVACYQEKARRWGVNKYVKETIDNNKFIPLKELSKMQAHAIADKDLADIFYNEAASVVYYMVTELGEYKFTHFCKELQEGRSFEDASPYVYIRFNNIESLNRAWVDYLKH